MWQQLRSEALPNLARKTHRTWSGAHCWCQHTVVLTGNVCLTVPGAMGAADKCSLCQQSKKMSCACAGHLHGWATPLLSSSKLRLHTPAPTCPTTSLSPSPTLFGGYLVVQRAGTVARADNVSRSGCTCLEHARADAGVRPCRAYATLDVHPGHTFVARLLSRATEILQYFSAQNISNTVWCAWAC